MSWTIIDDLYMTFRDQKCTIYCHEDDTISSIELDSVTWLQLIELDALLDKYTDSHIGTITTQNNKIIIDLI
jgi:hypothetical protein